MARIDSGREFDKDEHHEKMKERMENMDVKQYALRMPTNLYKKVRAKLLKEDKSLKSLIIEILEDYIKK
jgi:predicted HicB family RNase H-like nuclease